MLRRKDDLDVEIEIWRLIKMAMVIQSLLHASLISHSCVINSNCIFSYHEFHSGSVYVCMRMHLCACDERVPLKRKTHSAWRIKQKADIKLGNNIFNGFRRISFIPVFLSLGHKRANVFISLFHSYLARAKG